MSTTATNPFVDLLNSINEALDKLTELPDTAHGRETGQVEYKLNEAKLWLGVIPGAVEALVGSMEEQAAEADTAVLASPATNVSADSPVPVSAPAPTEPTATTSTDAGSNVPTADTPAPATVDVPNAAAGSGGQAATDPTADIPTR